MLRRLRFGAGGLAVAVSLCSPLGAAAVPAASAAPFTVEPAPDQAQVSFSVSYRGSGHWETTYHSTPPNPGGRNDDNTAHDSSVQKWRLTDAAPLVIPSCDPSATGGADPCQEIGADTTAHGLTSVTGFVSHRHIDGLYASDNVHSRCRLSERTPQRLALPAVARFTYDAQSQTVTVAAGDPLADAISLMPSYCPSIPDGIDGLQDNYFTPGFSFAAGYGPERWFTPSPVVIPIATLDAAAVIRIPLSEALGATPPVDCSVPVPAYETCHTGGSWSGTLTLTALS
jgi:hypothetical protein